MALRSWECNHADCRRCSWKKCGCPCHKATKETAALLAKLANEDTKQPV